MISILHLFSDFYNLKKKKKNKKKKQKQISKIEETNILIENPKQKRIKSKPIQPKKKKKEFWDAYETTFHNLIGKMD